MGIEKGRWGNWLKVLSIGTLVWVTSINYIPFALSQPPANWVSGIAYEVVPTAKITKISFYLGKTEAGEMLIFEVGIKNIGPKAARFKLTIYPLGGDPVSGYYPLTSKKGKPLALEPNEEMVSKWPVFSNELPSGFALAVKEVED